MTNEPNKESGIIRDFFLSIMVINNGQITAYVNGYGNLPYPTSGKMLNDTAAELAKMHNIKGNPTITSFTYTSEPYNEN